MMPSDRDRWAKKMFTRGLEPSPLQHLLPKPAPLTRAERTRRAIRQKIEAARLRVGSWIAGVDLEEH